ncbi:MAG: hypothetical protein JWN52_4389 [Actinomycetia bacterium]|jgi:hypothetical protein|nr:hypothetical protein [Actinomycetes bacterium]
MWVVAASALSSVCALIGWCSWLWFCRDLTDKHGIGALKSAGDVARS